MSRFILALLVTISVVIVLPTWTYSSLTSQISKDCAQLETDKGLYKPGEMVIVSFTNNCPDPITLSQPFPWMASCFSDDGQALPVVGRLAVQIITHIQPGQRLEDAWDLEHGPRSEYAAFRPEPVPEGRCIIQLDTVDAGRYTTNFEIRGGGATSLKDFDANDNSVIEDSELFAAVDQWVAGGIRDELFFAVLDAWVSQTPISSASLPTPVMFTLGHHLATFAVRDQGISWTMVEVFDLNGRRLFTQQTTGTRLIWNLKTESGKPLANGIYLAAITVHRPDGRITRKLQKLVVLR